MKNCPLVAQFHTTHMKQLKVVKRIWHMFLIFSVLKFMSWMGETFWHHRRMKSGISSLRSLPLSKQFTHTQPSEIMHDQVNTREILFLYGTNETHQLYGLCMKLAYFTLSSFNINDRKLFSPFCTDSSMGEPSSVAEDLGVPASSSLSFWGSWDPTVNK